MWFRWSSAAVNRLGRETDLVINPLIYAELSAEFKTIEDLERTVTFDQFRRDALPYEAGFLAGRAFVEYRRRGGSRRAPLTDFYIGAHAAVARYRLLTRDAKRYRTYFPGLEVIAPD